MRISDWSSDVCSSDLCPGHVRHHTAFVDYLEVAASGEIRECAVADAAILLPGEMGHEGPAGRIVHVAGAHHEATRAPPEILLAVAVEIQPRDPAGHDGLAVDRSEEHTSELQSLMRISYAVFCLKKKKKTYTS